MRRAVLTALLLLAAAPSAAARDLNQLFNEDFDGTPPKAGRAAVDVPPASTEQAPAAADQPPAATDSGGTAVPVPRPRPAHAIASTDGDAGAPASPSPSGPATGSIPPMPPEKSSRAKAATASVGDEGKASLPIVSGTGVGISWNALDPAWDGMFVTNGGGTALSVSGVRLDNRAECQLRPYSLEQIQKAFSVQQAVKAWGRRAINLFGLSKTDIPNVLVPPLPPDLQAAGLAPADVKIKAGGRLAIFNGTKCDKVTEAIVETDAGAVPVKFKQPYSGH